MRRFATRSLSCSRWGRRAASGIARPRRCGSVLPSGRPSARRNLTSRFGNPQLVAGQTGASTSRVRPFRATRNRRRSCQRITAPGSGVWCPRQLHDASGGSGHLGSGTVNGVVVNTGYSLGAAPEYPNWMRALFGRPLDPAVRYADVGNSPAAMAHITSLRTIHRGCRWCHLRGQADAPTGGRAVVRVVRTRRVGSRGGLVVRQRRGPVRERCEAGGTLPRRGASG